MGKPRRWVLTLVLTGLLLLWLSGPVIWLLLSGEIYPDSGTEPTPDQLRDMAVLNLAMLTGSVIVPAVVAVTAWRTGRRTLASITAAMFLAANLFLLIIEAPIWSLFAAATGNL